jgi:hypothetical protein
LANETLMLNNLGLIQIDTKCSTSEFRLVATQQLTQRGIA